MPQDACRRMLDNLSVTSGARRRRSLPLVLLVAVSLAASACGSGQHSPATQLDARAPLPCNSKQTFTYKSLPGVDPDLTSLDVYIPPASDGDCRDRALVVWIHGGGWTEGDKAEYMEDKVPLFTGAGFVFASINYRLTDDSASPAAPQYPIHDQDSADAVAWLIDHAAQLGVNPTRVAILGHSAGGGIIAAITTDDRYLGQHGLSIDAIRCAGAMDGEGYDVTAGATTAPPEFRPTYLNAFGTDPAVWTEASPINHVAAGEGIPDYFIAARGVDWRVEQQVAFIAALQSAGVATTVLDSRTLDHADLTTLVGAPGDTLVTPALMEFLGICFAS